MQVWIVLLAHVVLLPRSISAFLRIRSATNNGERARTLLHSALCLWVAVHSSILFIGFDGQNVFLNLMLPMLVLTFLAAVFAFFGCLHPSTRKHSMLILLITLAMFTFPLYAGHLPNWSGIPRGPQPDGGSENG